LPGPDITGLFLTALSPDYLRTTGLTLGDCLAPECVSVGFRCPEHISASRNRTSEWNSVFCWVFCGFPGMAK